MDLRDAIYDAAKARDRVKEAAVNPLVQDGRKLVPSVTRVFSTDREMYVFLQAYKPSTSGQPTTQPLLAFVSFYLAGQKVLETSPIAVGPSGATRLGVTPFSFSVALAGLTFGDYDCQITVLDPSTAKSTFWRAPIRLVR